jgi:hypothetical protein
VDDQALEAKVDRAAASQAVKVDPEAVASQVVRADPEAVALADLAVVVSLVDRAVE